MDKNLQQSIQMVRDGIQGIMKFLPSYLKENENVRGVKYTFRPNGLVPDALARTLDICDAIESIETIDSPNYEFLNSVNLGTNYIDYKDSIETELAHSFVTL